MTATTENVTRPQGGVVSLLHTEYYLKIKTMVDRYNIQRILIVTRRPCHYEVFLLYVSLHYTFKLKTVDSTSSSSAALLCLFFVGLLSVI